MFASSQLEAPPSLYDFHPLQLEDQDKTTPSLLGSPHFPILQVLEPSYHQNYYLEKQSFFLCKSVVVQVAW